MSRKSQNQETLTLILAFLITVGLLGGGIWYAWSEGIFSQLLSRRENSAATGNHQSSGQPNSEYAKTLAAVSQVPGGLFNYGGSTTWAPIRAEVDSVIQSEHREFRLRYTDPITGTPGSGRGIKMLLDHQLAFSQSSRPLKAEEYEQARRRGFELQSIPVAIDGIAIAVNHSLAIPGLTVQQLRDIYTGRITNWQQVGGPNLPITPYSRRREDGGTVEFFVQSVLGGQDLANTVEYVYSTTPGLRAVADNPGGIYYASAPEVVPQCQVKTLPLGRSSSQFVAPYQAPAIAPSQCPAQRDRLNFQAFQSGDYPITRRLFVIVKQNGQIDEQAGRAYANLLLTDRGQELIAEAGFVPIR